MVTADADARPVQLSHRPGAGGCPHLPHRRRLGDRHVVKGPEGANHDARQHQALKPHFH